MAPSNPIPMCTIPGPHCRARPWKYPLRKLAVKIMYDSGDSVLGIIQMLMEMVSINQMCVEIQRFIRMMNSSFFSFLCRKVILDYAVNIVQIIVRLNLFVILVRFK